VAGLRPPSRRRSQRRRGRPVLTLHGLRHTHATVLLEAGENPKVVQERLGHTTFTTTMDIYSHVTPTMQRAAVDRFAAAVSGAD
jgi:integrase